MRWILVACISAPFPELLVTVTSSQGIADLSGASTRVAILQNDPTLNAPNFAEAMAEADARVNVLHRSGKAGLGAAYIAGFDWGLDAGYDVLVEMDADGSHDPADLPKLLTALQDADLVIGSRWVPGGAVYNWPRSRQALSRCANMYTRMMLGIAIRDADRLNRAAFSSGRNSATDPPS